MRLLRMILLGLSAGGMVMPGAALAQTPTLVDFATISMSAPGVPRTVTNTLCATDGRDLVCDRGAQLLPNGVISTTGLVVNGVSVTGGGGGSASATNVPAFSVRRTTDQYIGPLVAVQFNVKDFDTFNDYNIATAQFKPSVAGRYIITVSVYCAYNYGGCLASILKNGAVLTYGSSRSGATDHASVATIIVDMNGTTDYIAAGASGQSYDVVTGPSTRMSGSLLASGNGLASSGTTALGDRIISGTASGVVAMAGGTISFTTGGTSGTAYLDTLGRFIGAGVSTTGAVSAASIYAGSSLQLASPTAVTACNSGAAGTIRYNSPTTTLELCTGSGWQPMGVGIPAGTISAFASTSCPTGWSEYTAARGQFLRGIDNGAGHDPSGTRAPGDAQADALQNIQGEFKQAGTNGGMDGTLGAFYVKSNPANYSAPDFPATGTVGRAAFDASRVARTSTETRPKNVAVTFCQFNGTSNGWNNPLSGGSTSAAGSTGQVQYNTAGSFDASPDFSWSNGSKVLGVNGGVSTTKTISTTDVFMAKTGGQCSTAADIGRMFRSATTGKLQICADRN